MGMDMIERGRLRIVITRDHSPEPVAPILFLASNEAPYTPAQSFRVGPSVSGRDLG